ncbi:hypothetical protein FB567DRAFT_548870 [Paraphoma chrysanthemicola]|uniref:Heterokaryon incompatibility domain-containing protein n=1 Tax=Paraphoma chrysanthemicola TaxID=798071 RepID=A0A8K0R8S4_9PLEO|nr:hypothetical protein FB567DRAFT_548870 [Paraphoma chrysanthemicola]
MAKLYSQAQQVCVWLGEASTLSSVGMKSFTSGWSEIGLNVSSSKLLRNYAVLDWREGLKSSEAMQRQADLGREFQLGEIRELLSRPWWTRVWIMQEAIVARKLVFMCGGDSAPWISVDSFIKRAVIDKGAVTSFGIVLNAEFALLNASHTLFSDLRRR